MPDTQKLLLVLTEGKADNGRKATIAFSMGLSALAMGLEVTVFLTSDAAVWGYDKSGFGISVPGFLPLEELIAQYGETGGSLLLCSTCHMTCGAGDPRLAPNVEKLPTVKIAGMATVIEFAIGGTTMTF